MLKSSATISLLKALVEKPSITPDDAGCQKLLAERLLRLGFKITDMSSGDVTNLWAIRGSAQPLFVFAGHTDVVPTGQLSDWTFPPFEPTVHNGHLYGRGTADMKGSVAAMIVACEQFIQQHPNHKGSIGFLITSDEEGPAIHGTQKVIEQLSSAGIQIQYCLVGEPTSDKQLADVIKNGRRGSLTGHLTIIGKQGHVAYPDKAINPIHISFQALHNIVQHAWDEATEAFPQTTLQISNLHAGTGATNVIPNTLECTFNFRFGTQSNVDQLKKQVETYLNQANLHYNLNWRLGSLPFLSNSGKLESSVQTAIQRCLGYQARITTDGGTSDARFIVPTGAEVIELGPINASIHAIDERISIDDLEKLTHLYQNILEELLA